MICRNCGSDIVISTIGTHGGCNPIPLDSHVDGGTLVIDAAALEPVRDFKDLSGQASRP